MQVLRQIGIYGDDLKVARGDVPRGAMRKWPYNIITIPRLNKQIAVNDQIGHVMLVADTIHPLDFWVVDNKTQLKAPHPTVTNIRYQDGWQQRLQHSLIGDSATVDKEHYPKQKMPRAARGVVYSESILKQWIEWFHEQEGKRLSVDDKSIWIKDDTNPDQWWELDGKTWFNVEYDLRNGSNGMAGGSSLAQFKDEYGFVGKRPIIAQASTGAVVQPG